MDFCLRSLMVVFQLGCCVVSLVGWYKNNLFINKKERKREKKVMLYTTTLFYYFTMLTWHC
jgi:hypothetical protein